MGILPPRLKRALTLALLAASGAALWILGGPSCPIWRLGAPCPGCGLTRATQALAERDLGSAFGFNPFFPYYLALMGLLGLGFLLFALGREPEPESFAKRTVFRVPLPLHASIYLGGLAYNLWHYGFNPDGLAPRAWHWFGSFLG